MSELIVALQALIKIPSPNPLGDTQAIGAYIAQRLSVAGCQVVVAAPPQKPSAPSVVATIGNDSGPSLIFHAHIDTVPIGENEHWTYAPYAAEIHAGKVYGKGSVDDKAPLAAMLVVMESLARLPLRGRLTLVAAAEEEVGGQLGTRWLVDAGYVPESDFVVVGEQTHNRVATANKGVLRATIRTFGRSVHATNPDRGVNAVQKMARVLLALEAYHQRLALRTHPLVGAPTCNVGVIHGGTASNVVPDLCEIKLDRRMLPGETPEAVQAELCAVVQGLDLGEPVPTVGDFLVSAAFEANSDAALTQAFLAQVRRNLQADPGPIGYLPGSDAKHLVGVARQGIVVFGPGSYEVAHAADEYVEIQELEQTAQILDEFARLVLCPEQTSRV